MCVTPSLAIQCWDVRSNRSSDTTPISHFSIKSPRNTYAHPNLTKQRHRQAARMAATLLLRQGSSRRALLSSSGAAAGRVRVSKSACDVSRSGQQVPMNQPIPSNTTTAAPSRVKGRLIVERVLQPHQSHESRAQWGRPPLPGGRRRRRDCPAPCRGGGRPAGRPHAVRGGERERAGAAGDGGGCAQGGASAGTAGAD